MQYAGIWLVNLSAAPMLIAGFNEFYYTAVCTMHLVFYRMQIEHYRIFYETVPGEN
jgi:hypothetical protein